MGNSKKKEEKVEESGGIQFQLEEIKEVEDQSRLIDDIDLGGSSPAVGSGPGIDLSLGGGDDDSLVLENSSGGEVDKKSKAKKDIPAKNSEPSIPQLDFGTEEIAIAQKAIKEEKLQDLPDLTTISSSTSIDTLSDLKRIKEKTEADVNVEVPAEKTGGNIDLAAELGGPDDAFMLEADGPVPSPPSAEIANQDEVEGHNLEQEEKDDAQLVTDPVSQFEVSAAPTVTLQEDGQDVEQEGESATVVTAPPSPPPPRPPKAHREKTETRKTPPPPPPTEHEDEGEEFIQETHFESEHIFEDSLPLPNSKNSSGSSTSYGDKTSTMINVMSYDANEMARIQATLRHMRDEREQLMKELEQLKAELKKAQQNNLGMKAELDEGKIELSIVKKRYGDQFKEFSYQLQLSEEKKSILEGKLKKYQQEILKLNEKVRSDFNKIKNREKELEGQLELLSMDSAAQIQGRDQKIAELKRKIDSLEFNMETATIQNHKNKEERVKMDDKVSKVINTLKNTLRVLEQDIELQEDKAERENVKRLRTK